MIVPYTHLVLLGGILFLLGVICMLTRRNLIMILLGLEIMLNAAAVTFAGAGLHLQHIEGQVMALFILAVAAAEVSVGLALIVCVYRQTGSVDPGCVEGDQCRLDPGTPAERTNI